MFSSFKRTTFIYKIKLSHNCIYFYFTIYSIELMVQMHVFFQIRFKLNKGRWWYLFTRFFFFREFIVEQKLKDELSGTTLSRIILCVCI